MKRNLIILLIIPFLIALLGIVTISSTFNFIQNDIIRIEWSYSDNEAFKVRDELYLLNATGISEKDYPAGPNNELVWSLTNADSADQEVHAEITELNDYYYLKAISPGNVIITCSNAKGNVSKSFNALIYEGAYILLNSEISASGNNIDPNIYYGQYDLDGTTKVNARITFDVSSSEQEVLDTIVIKELSNGLKAEVDNEQIIVEVQNNASTEEYVVVSCEDEALIDSVYTLNLNIVKDGVNVYSYEDLLNCTNRSEEGEIVVLRKSFESLANYEEQSDKNNVELFGTYNNGSFNFEDEAYFFETTYNTDYIDSWNEYMKNDEDSQISKDLVAGIHVQKDFYGNGYTINLHNLTYPTDVTQVTSDGGVINVPTLSQTDLFRGPLPYYTLGNHNSMPLIEALGQDNVGLYVDGNNITVNDLTIKNCDFGNMLSNLHYTGTVVDVYGNNNTIINCNLSNGRCVLRVYESMNTSLINTMLSNSRNFLVSIGSNECIPIDDNTEFEFTDSSGNKATYTIAEYLAAEGIGDEDLNDYVMGEYEDKEKIRTAILSIQEALNDASLIEGQYHSSLTIEDCLFYQSGIASISIDSMFNGPFLYSGAPSAISNLLGVLVDYVPTNVGGLSYPVKVDITGSTKFYDYKTYDGMDISGIINENISAFASDAGDIFDTEYDGEISIDMFFPLKEYLFSSASTYSDGKDTYVNVPVVFYGGAKNMSVCNIDTIDMKAYLVSDNEIDLLDNYLDLTNSSTLNMIRNLMCKAVTVVIGYEPFKYTYISDGYLFGKTPELSELKENARNKQ